MYLKDFTEASECAKKQQTFLLHAELYCDGALALAYQISQVTVEYSVDAKRWEQVPSKQLIIGRPYCNKRYSCIQGRYGKSKLSDGILISIPPDRKVKRLQLRIMWTLSSKEVMSDKSKLCFFETVSADVLDTDKQGIFFIKSRLMPAVILDSHECLFKDVFPNTAKNIGVRRDSLYQGRELIIADNVVHVGTEWYEDKQYSEQNREEELMILSNLVSKTNLQKELLYVLFLYSKCEAKHISLGNFEYTQGYVEAWPATPRVGDVG